MRRLIVILVLVLFAAPLFAGGTDEAQDDEPIVVRVLSYFPPTDDEYPIYYGWLEEFQAMNPNVEYDYEGLESADARTKLAVEMASGNPPDLAYMVTGLAREYSAQGLLLDLRPHVSADPEWEASYKPTSVESVSWDGGMWLIPGSAHFGGLYYNPDVLAEAGFDGPAETWDELLEQAVALRGIGKYAFLTSGQNVRYAWLISQIMVRTAGVDRMASLYRGDLKTSWDDPDAGFVAALERLQELVDVEAFPADVNGLTGEVAQLLFGDGEAAYWYEGTWHVNGFANNIGEEFRDNLGWATFPTIAGAAGDQDGGVGGPLLGWGVSGVIDDPVKEEIVVQIARGIESREIATQQLTQRAQLTGARPLGDNLPIHPLLQTILDAYDEIPVTAYPTDVAAPSPVDNAIKRIAVPGIIDGSLTVMEAVAEVNARAVEFWEAQ